MGDELVHREAPSPNFNYRALPISMVVLHYTEMLGAEAACARMYDPATEVSAHYLIAEDGEVTRDGVIADEDAEEASERIEDGDDVDRVKDALRRLPEREMQVISLYYYEGLTLKEIGKILGVTESRVSQIHGKALSVLRGLLRS